MELRNRSTPQLPRDTSSIVLDATTVTPHENDHDILKEIAEQMRRTRGDIEKQMQHSEGAALRAAILAGQEALSKGKSKEEVAAVIESAGGDVCGRANGRALILSQLLRRSSAGHERNAMALPKRRPTYRICAQAVERQRR